MRSCADFCCAVVSGEDYLLRYKFSICWTHELRHSTTPRQNTGPYGIVWQESYLKAFCSLLLNVLTERAQGLASANDGVSCELAGVLAW